MKFPPKISEVEVLDDTRLLIEFDNQQRRIYDVSQLFHLPQFQPLKNPQFLKQFEIAGGYALVWNEEVDISENHLWNKGIPTERRISIPTD